MAQQTSTMLKSYFETDDKPTQQNFEDLIDSKQQTLVPNGLKINPKPNGSSDIYIANTKDDSVVKIWVGTEEEYNSIESKDTNTIYNII